MGNILSIKEIVDMGVQVEKNGKEFYNIVSAKSDSEKAKEIFDFLAAEEDKHITAFEKILSSVEHYDASAGAYTDEYFGYVKALASEHIFTKEKLEKLIEENVNNDIGAIDLAMSFEKDSIIFFSELRKVVKDSDKDIVQKLIDQEKEHLRKLVTLKNILSEL